MVEEAATRSANALPKGAAGGGSGERQFFEEMDQMLQITEGDPAPQTLHYEPFRLGAG